MGGAPADRRLITSFLIPSGAPTIGSTKACYLIQIALAMGPAADYKAATTTNRLSNVMPRPIILEALAQTAIENAISGAKSEDSRVELKSVLPDPQNAARQIAALCNAVSGGDALWVVGFDEKSRAFTLLSSDLARWWPKVVSSFDGTAPSKDYNITFEDNPLLLLHFDTTMRPFVVKGTDGNTVVPWRSNTTTRNATRSELLKLFVPTITQPGYEIVKAEITFDWRNQRLTGAMEIYLIPTSDVRLVVPLHKCDIVVKANGRSLSFPPATISWFSPPGTRLDSPLQLLFEKPDFFGFVAEHRFDELDEPTLNNESTISFLAGFAGSEMTIEIRAMPPETSIDSNLQRFSQGLPRWFRR